MLQITSKNFNKRRMKIEVQYGKKIRPATKDEHVAEALYEKFKTNRKVEIHMDFKLGHCAICEDVWKSGDFAIEKVMLVPKSGEVHKGEKPTSLRVTIPRVVCCSCSKSMAEDEQLTPEESATSSTLGSAWRVYTEVSPKTQHQSTTTGAASRPKSQTQKQSKTFQRGPAIARSPPVRFPAGGARAPASNPNLRPSPNFTADTHSMHEQMDNLDIEPSGGDTSTGSVTPNSGKDVMKSERDVNKTGFLVCTQLVKTGGADKAGLQVGDIFVRLGHMTKPNFQGLKDVANFIRSSANMPIEAVVLRRQNVDTRGARGALFHTIKLRLTPLQSHDADGGGVLGAVMNLWPKPEARHRQPYSGQ